MRKITNQHKAPPEDIREMTIIRTSCRINVSISAYGFVALSSNRAKVFMHQETCMEGGLSLDTLSSYCNTNPVACSWLDFYDDCEGQVRWSQRVL